MRVYLLNPPFVPNFVRCGRWQGATARSGGLDYPKWLAYATGLLGESGHVVKLVDAVANGWGRNDLLEDITDFKPDVVVAECNFSSVENDISVLQELKQKCKAITVLVGPPTCQYADSILSEEGVDFVVRYEFDLVLKELIDAIDTGSSIVSVKSISYKGSNGIVHNERRDLSNSIELDSLPFVSKVYKDHLDISKYFLSQCLFPEVQIFAGRGCPNQCTFCSWPENLTGRKYRVRSVDNLVAEFEWIRDNIPEVREIFIEDDAFTIKSSYVKEFCKKLIERKVKMTWSCNSRATLDLETLKLMKESGCRLLIIGYESGNEDMLERIKKGVTKQQMLEFTKAAKKARILIHGDFIIGLPGETKETAGDTLRFIKQIRPNVLQVAVATPLPGTKFYEEVKEGGYLLVDDLVQSIDQDGFQKCIISYPNLTKEEIEALVARALKEFYLTPSFFPIFLSNVFRRNGMHELKAMLSSAKVFLRYIRS